jgi:hypothetical protein
MAHGYRPRFEVGVAGRRASSPNKRSDRTLKEPRRSNMASAVAASPDASWDTRPLLDALVELHDPARR